MVKSGSDGASRREAGRAGNIKDVFASKAISSYKTPRRTEDKLTATNKQTNKSQDNVRGHGENRMATSTKKGKKIKNKHFHHR